MATGTKMIALVRVHFDTSAPWATNVAVVRALGVFVERLSGRISFSVHCRRKMFLAMMIIGVIFLMTHWFWHGQP